MRPHILLIAACVGCADAPPLADDDATARLGVSVALPAESDAFAPPWLPEPLALADGTTLVQRGHELFHADGDDAELVVFGRLLGTPSVTADKRTVAFPHEVGESGRHGVSLLTWHDGTWRTAQVLAASEPMDRVALSPDGDRLAFVWAGEPEAGTIGVPAIYIVDLPDGVAVRRSNLSPALPGKPPADFVDVPVGRAPVWDGDTLRWTSRGGAHALDVTR